VKLPAKFRERYGPIAPEGFFEALGRGLPKTVRVNTLKTTREEFMARAGRNGWELTSLPWLADGFAIDREDRTVPLGHSLEHFAGHLYIQEASSMVPPLVLDPRPGERVLDLAAAPGSKTTQMAAMMGNRGLLAANDSSIPRIKALTANLERTGTLNTVVLNGSGHRVGRMLEGYFDKVLLDAPCTAEGTIAKSREVIARWSENSIKKLATLQGKLLLGAWAAVKPGGTLVYSTCTFAPEENEGVLDAFLSLHPEADVEPFELPGLHAVPGVGEWQGNVYDPRVTNGRRIWPGNEAMEGFFIARLRKPPGASPGAPLRIFDDRRYQPAVDGPDAWLGERFGLPEGWDEGCVWRAKDEERWMMSPEAAAFQHLPAVRRGLRGARTVRSGFKPTTDWLQLVGKHAGRRIVETTETDARRYLGGADLPAASENGYIGLRHADITYAVGLGQADRIKNQLPTSRRLP
jgi:NOL1/NOP2/sun family putative RNA methylase